MSTEPVGLRQVDALIAERDSLKELVAAWQDAANHEREKVKEREADIEWLAALLMEVGEGLNRAGWLMSFTDVATVLAEELGPKVAEDVGVIAAASARFHEWKNPEHKP